MEDRLIEKKKAAIYHGCFANYYYPEVGEAAVKVLRKNGIEVAVPDQVCCALPMVAKGNIKGAIKNMEFNTKVLAGLVSEGYAIIGPCSSCSLMIKRDYPKMLDTAVAKLVSDNFYHLTEYLVQLKNKGLLDTNFSTIEQTVFYLTPCHLRAQEIGSPSTDLLKLIPGTKVNYISNECCGMSGAYGYEKKNYKLSKEIAGKLQSEIAENPTDLLVTDCGGCKLQMEAVGNGGTAVHPIVMLKEAYGL
ncbi:heterodisulfide reductase-related iron-sulfur binding cluster [Chloroflexota bacterium]